MPCELQDNLTKQTAYSKRNVEIDLSSSSMYLWANPSLRMPFQRNHTAFVYWPLIILDFPVRHLHNCHQTLMATFVTSINVNASHSTRLRLHITLTHSQASTTDYRCRNLKLWATRRTIYWSLTTTATSKPFFGLQYLGLSVSIIARLEIVGPFSFI